MSTTQFIQGSSNAQAEDVFLHLKEVIVVFDDDRRPKSDIVVKFDDKAGFDTTSQAFKKADEIRWQANIYVKSYSKGVLTIRTPMPMHREVAKFTILFDPVECGNKTTIERRDEQNGALMRFKFGTSKPFFKVVRILGDQARSVLASKLSMLSKLDTLLDFLDVIMVGAGAGELNIITKVVVSIVNQVMAKFRAITTCHKQFVEIMNDLVSLLPVMKSASCRLQEAECLELVQSFVVFILETSKGLIEYASPSTIGFVVRNWSKSKKDEVTKLKDRSNNLRSNLILGVSLDTHFTVSDIQKRQLKEEERKILKRIKPPKGSCFNPEHCCMPGTRSSMINAVTAFATEEPSARIYWLYGIAGSGKSSVAASVAMALHNRDRLSGSFFCKRDVPELRNPIKLIHTLAHAIAEAYISYRNVVMEVLKADVLLQDKTLAVQFDALLRVPLYRVSQEPPQESLIFVVDALDECEDNRSISEVLSQVVELAPWIRLIVTSRPLPQIGDSLRRVKQLMETRDLFSEDVHQDIESFIRGQLSIGGPLNDIHKDVDDLQVRILVQKSAGLFIWIATVLLHVSRLLVGRHKSLLDIIASNDASSLEAQLDALYLQVLHNVTGSSSANRLAVKSILALIFATSRNRSLPPRAIYAFISRERIRVSQGELDSFLRQMGSVLMTDAQTGSIRVCHPSFLDFIGHQLRSKEFWIRTAEVDAIMAKKCFEIMGASLRFNICGLETATLRNDEVFDLQERIARHVPEELRYSCIYWFDHLSRSDDTCKLQTLNVVLAFLRGAKPLFWLEVLSLISELKAAIATLWGLSLISKGNSVLRDTALDYHTFVSVFHEPISKSTPHLYVSALLWTPSSSAISNIHYAKFHPQPLILVGRDKVWPACLQVIECKEAYPVCVAYSLDGCRIVSGHRNGLVCIWDSWTGASLGEPLIGHTDSVNSVAYSPDGSCIASGSSDCTVRIWKLNTLSGMPVGAPLVVKHEHWVESVAYSPDGSRIVSASGGMWCGEGVVQIWDAHSGEPVGPSLVAPTINRYEVAYSSAGPYIASSGMRTLGGGPPPGWLSTLCSDAFSSDKSRIVSRGKNDRTIQIWDAQSGTLIGEPLLGLNDVTFSIAFSSDKSRIIAYSDELTIRIWDAVRRTPIAVPLEGHTNDILAIKFSPDNTRIASASIDGTIRIWDTRRGGPATVSPVGHTNMISSLSCSPDGSRITTGSWDKTIIIWDATSGRRIGKPLVGHTGGVLTVTFSSDGSRIASGSYDRTVRIWDVLDRVLISTLVGHTKKVDSVVFSPDGSRLASASSSDGTVRVWDALSGAPISSFPVGYSFRSMEYYSRDALRIHSGRILDSQQTVFALDAVTGTPVGEPLVHTNDNEFDRYIRAWRALRGKPINMPMGRITGSFRSAAVSPDGSRIAAASYESLVVRIWDIASGLLIGEPLMGHTSQMRSIEYSPDGSRIVSRSKEGTIRIFNACTDEQNDGARSVPDDGWIRSEEGGLLLWVPHESRNGVGDMSLVCIPDDVIGHRVRVDWEGVSDAWDRMNRERGVQLIA